MRRIHTTGRPDSWIAPRQLRDESQRAMIYGQLLPMEEPSALQRFLGRFFR